MTINDLHMTEEQIVNEIQFMRMWDKYLQKMLGKEKHSELSLGFARMLTSAELKSFGASDEEIEKACNFADMMAIADEHKADTPQNEQMKTADYCDICKQDMCKDCIADATNPYCVPSHYEIKQTEPIADTPQTDCETCRHYKLACELFSEICKYEPITQTETQNSNNDTPQTDCGWK